MHAEITVQGARVRLTEQEWARIGREKGWLGTTHETVQPVTEFDEVDAEIDPVRRTAEIKNAAQLPEEAIMRAKARFEELGFRVTGLPRGDWELHVQVPEDRLDGVFRHTFRRKF